MSRRREEKAVRAALADLNRTTTSRRRDRRHHRIGLAFLVLVAGGLLLLLPKSPPGGTTPAAPVTPTAAAGARAQLGQLTAGEDQDVGHYTRAAFLPHGFGDPDRNGCDARNDVLRRDLTAVKLRTGSRCVVVAGQLADPYTGEHVTFTKADAAAVQVDHIVSLAEAWRSGAWHWTSEQRVAFGSDARNLAATAADVNREKSDKSPGDGWSPDAAHACQFAVRYVTVKAAWHLTVTEDERGSLDRMLNTCPRDPVASAGNSR